ncbi:MAG: histidine phosphatase family protein [Actinobacteria bacterium]|nr:histidine phosphatase family protein [Actinomycetota bacterium]
MNLSRIVLWRHGRTEWNLNQRWQGQSDIPLDIIGKAQAEAAAEMLARLQPSMLVSSDLVRASKTAEFLSHVTGLEVVLDKRLRETDGGLWEGLTYSEIEEQHGDSLRSWQQDISAPAGVTGETRGAVAARVIEAITEYAKVATGTLVVATHGGSARAATLELLGLPMKHHNAFKVLSNAGWVVLDRDPTHNIWRISDYNVSAMPPMREVHL